MPAPLCGAQPNARHDRPNQRGQVLTLVRTRVGAQVNNLDACTVVGIYSFSRSCYGIYPFAGVFRLYGWSSELLISLKKRSRWLLASDGRLSSSCTTPLSRSSQLLKLTAELLAIPTVCAWECKAAQRGGTMVHPSAIPQPFNKYITGRPSRCFAFKRTSKTATERSKYETFRPGPNGYHRQDMLSFYPQRHHDTA